MSGLPDISVVIPVYNRPDYLRQSAASVLAQEGVDFELIIVDDASTDDTPEAAAEIASRDTRVRVVRHNGRHGPGGPRNAGVRAARAGWVAFLDSDDSWFPHTLARLAAARAEDVALIASDFEITDGSGDVSTMKGFLHGTMIPWWESYPAASAVIDCGRLRREPASMAEPETVLAMALGNYLWISTSVTMVRKSAFEEAGGFDPRKLRGEDMDLWMGMLKRGRFVYVDEVLMRCRAEGRAEGGGDRYAAYAKDRRHDAYLDAVGHLRFIRSLRRRFPLDAAARRLWRERMEAHHRICGYRALCLRRPAALYHYAVALGRSRSQRTLLRRAGRDFFRTPW